MVRPHHPGWAVRPGVLTAVWLAVCRLGQRAEPWVGGYAGYPRGLHLSAAGRPDVDTAPCRGRQGQRTQILSPRGPVVISWLSPGSSLTPAASRAQGGRRWLKDLPMLGQVCGGPGIGRTGWAVTTAGVCPSEFPNGKRRTHRPGVRHPVGVHCAASPISLFLLPSKAVCFPLPPSQGRVPLFPGDDLDCQNT